MRQTFLTRIGCPRFALVFGNERHETRDEKRLAAETTQVERGWERKMIHGIVAYSLRHPLSREILLTIFGMFHRRWADTAA